MKTKFVLSVCIACILSSSSSLLSKENRAEEYLRENVVERRLPNGVTVLLLNRGYAPTLAFNMSFRVGSVDETYDTAGAAHLLEHMLFKGTDTIGTKNYKKERPILDRIEAIGATIDHLELSNPGNSRLPALRQELKSLQKELSQYVVSSPYDKIYTAQGSVGFNASTSRDKTGYYIELPSSKLELWARIESERLRNPVFREFYLERNNVIEERRMRYGSSGTSSLFEIFLSTAFSAHPYRHPTIGWKSNIPFLTLKRVREFYYTYYIPSRMTITIVGKQDTEKTFSVLKKYFSSLPTRPEPMEVTVKEPLARGEKRFAHYFESNPALVVGWHKPSFPSRDDFVLDVAAEYLSGGKSSPLYQALVSDKKIASSVSAWNGTPGARYNNLFVVFASPRSPHSAEKCEREIYTTIDHALKNLTQKDIQNIINRIEASMIFGLDTNKGIGHLLSYYQTVLGNWKYGLNYLKVVGTITPEEVRTVARKYLKKNNRTVGILYDSRMRETNK